MNGQIAVSSRVRLVSFGAAHYSILKHIAEVGSVRQGDPIAHVVSVFQYGKTIRVQWSHALAQYESYHIEVHCDEYSVA